VLTAVAKSSFRRGFNDNKLTAEEDRDAAVFSRSQLWGHCGNLI